MFFHVRPPSRVMCRRPSSLPAQSVSFTTLRQLFPNTEGRLPYAPLVQGADGLLYGTASRGGTADQGTVFRLDPDGGNFLVLHRFNGPPNDGARPIASSNGSTSPTSLVPWTTGAFISLAPGSGKNWLSKKPR